MLSEQKKKTAAETPCPPSPRKPAAVEGPPDLPHHTVINYEGMNKIEVLGMIPKTAGHWEIFEDHDPRGNCGVTYHIFSENAFDLRTQEYYVQHAGQHNPWS